MNSKLLARRLALAKEAYEQQLNRREQASKRFTTTVGVYAIVGGILAYYLSDLHLEAYQNAHLWFYLPCLFGIGCAAIGYFFILRLLIVGTPFRVLNTASRIDAGIVESVSDLPDNETIHGKVLSALDEAILAQYRECASFNQHANDKRDRFYTLALRLATLSVTFLLLSLPAFIYISSANKDNVTKVVVTHPLKIVSENENTEPAEPTESAEPAGSAEPTLEPVVQIELPEPIEINEARKLPLPPEAPPTKED